MVKILGREQNFIGGDRARSEPAGVSPFDREVLDRRAKFSNSKFDLEFWKFLTVEFIFGRANVLKIRCS